MLALLGNPGTSKRGLLCYFLGLLAWENGEWGGGFLDHTDRVNLNYKSRRAPNTLVLC